MNYFCGSKSQELIECRVKIFSGDQDMFQLVDPKMGVSVLHIVNALYRKRAKLQKFSTAEVQKKLGILPSPVVDYKALCDDTSDNIPGIKGISKRRRRIY